MKVIITGANGQVGWELQRTVPADIEVIALQRSELDITNPEQVIELINRERPDWVINAAAYTAVDKAEEESDLAYAINRDGAANIAKACKRVGARMLQISTDFVFDGKQGTPYLTSSKPNPLSIYGASKQDGDEAVLKTLGEDCTIMRTSWVYSAHGNNFVKTMLRLMSEREELGIVADQVGTPTWANGLASAIWVTIQKGGAAIQHWSDYGVASWYDFAIAIHEEGTTAGLINSACTIKPIRTDQYPVKAIRPQFSVMDTSESVSQLGCESVHWRVALRSMLADMVNFRKKEDGGNDGEIV